MNKSWNTLSWILTVAAQVTASYLLVLLSRMFVDYSQVQTLAQFLMIPLTIWLSYSVGVFGIGMIALVLKKVKPTAAVLRLITTITLAVVPMLVLVFNGVTVGMEDQQFQELVIGRMVPYYTQLCAAFALVGFFVTIWWRKVAPKPTLTAASNAKAKAAAKKGK